MDAEEVEANLMKTILMKVAMKTCSMVVEEEGAVTAKRITGATVPTLPGVLSASTRNCVLPVPKLIFGQNKASARNTSSIHFLNLDSHRISETITVYH